MEGEVGEEREEEKEEEKEPGGEFRNKKMAKRAFKNELIKKKKIAYWKD